MGLTAPAVAPIRLRLMAGCSGRLQAHRGHRLLQHLHTLSAGANPPFQTWGILPLCPYTSQKPLPLKPRSHAAAAPSPVPAHATGLASEASSHPGHGCAVAIPPHVLLLPASMPQGGRCDPGAGGGAAGTLGAATLRKPAEVWAVRKDLLLAAF